MLSPLLRLEINVLTRRPVRQKRSLSITPVSKPKNNEELTIEVDTPSRELKPSALANIGNTCYINTALQCIRMLRKRGAWPTYEEVQSAWKRQNHKQKIDWLKNCNFELFEVRDADGFEVRDADGRKKNIYTEYNKLNKQLKESGHSVQIDLVQKEKEIKEREKKIIIAASSNDGFLEDIKTLDNEEPLSIRETLKKYGLKTPDWKEGMTDDVLKILQSLYFPPFGLGRVSNVNNIEVLKKNPNDKLIQRWLYINEITYSCQTPTKWKHQDYQYKSNIDKIIRSDGQHDFQECFTQDSETMDGPLAMQKDNTGKVVVECKGNLIKREEKVLELGDVCYILIQKNKGLSYPYEYNQEAYMNLPVNFRSHEVLTSKTSTDDTYDLIAIICKSGKAKSGHYWCIGRQSHNHRWWRMSDNDIKPIEPTNGWFLDGEKLSGKKHRNFVGAFYVRRGAEFPNLLGGESKFGASGGASKRPGRIIRF